MFVICLLLDLASYFNSLAFNATWPETWDMISEPPEKTNVPIELQLWFKFIAVDHNKHNLLNRHGTL